MQTYTYKARDNLGKVVKGTIAARDELDLSNKVRKLGYFLTQSKVQIGKKKITKPHRLSAREVINFTTQLATLIDAGVPLVGSLNDLARDSQNPHIREVIDDIRFRVEAGSTLQEAISHHRKTFSDLYIATVGAGESTGKLSPVLNDLTDFLEWQQDLRSKIKEASIYPSILFSTMIAVVILLVVRVIPMFEPIFADFKVELPLPTRAVLGVSYLVRTYWYAVLGVVILLVGGYKFLGSKEKGRYIEDKMKLRIPIIGDLLRKVALSRFCHTFALSLTSGISILSALDVSARVIGNKYLEYLVFKARDAVNVGEKISLSLRASNEFPPLVTRMISVGEQSGSLSETLGKVNQYYDKEVPLVIKRMFAIFEPLMIVVMGVVVGGIALAVLLPLLRIVELVGG